MIKTVFAGLLLVHLLGDFYFQTQKMADRKKERFSWTVCHSLVYMLCSGILFFLFLPGMKLRYAALFVLSHAFIDIVKYAVLRLFRAGNLSAGNFMNSRNVFLIDQAAHLIMILGTAYWMCMSDSAELYRKGIGEFLNAFDLSGTILLRWAVVLVLIHKPANILIAGILSFYRPEDDEDLSSGKVRKDRNAGRMIGTLERVIMVLFIAIGQYSAVGLVLTAKSIARYDRISKDQQFAEYYLLGTLLSTICAAAAALLFL